MITRRRLFGTLACAAFAGCSSLTQAKPLKIAVQNFAPSKQAILVSITHDEEELFSQYIEVPEASQNQKPRVETVVSLARVSNGDRVEVSATLVDTTTSDGGYKIIDCPERYRLELVAISIEADGTLNVTGDSESNLCTETGIKTPDSTQMGLSG
jgi:hypothetical protein